MVTATETIEKDDKAEEAAKNINIRNFRSVPDIENFYRFIYENALREEGKKALKLIVDHFKKIEKSKKRSRKRKKKNLQ